MLTMPETMSLERRGAAARVRRQARAHARRAKGMHGAIAKAERDRARRCPNAVHARSSSRTRRTRRSTARTTAEEIWHDTDGQVDALSRASAPAARSPASRRCIKQRKPSFQAIAVEPDARARCSRAAPPGPHKIQGIGAGFVPEVLDLTLVDQVIRSPTTTPSRWRAGWPQEEGHPLRHLVGRERARRDRVREASRQERRA